MDRHLDFAGVHNFRDLGGYRAEDGRTVRWRQLFRADALSSLRPADGQRFRALGIGTVIDLRYPYEIAANGRVPQYDGLTYHNLSVEHRPYEQAALDPAIEPARYFADRYAELLADGTAELRRALEVIAFEAEGPVVFHCRTGKDRTGVLAALLLVLLGVAEEDVVADYALTGLATERFIADWNADPRKPPLRWPGYGQAPEETMRLVLAELVAAHGSVAGYVRGLGLDDVAVATALRDRFLESVPADRRRD
ncbi:MULTISPECIES: tyrosine-protein phosphatase [Actinoalloteichus]|uniref:Protein tyrosine/serine phosphatase n=1 Tax=Actinoalloteichus fjordicus TaxID=1612552 RepID=A0AAC9PSM0_9PSEU|nr:MULTISPECIES: tyrosine-protein phosphatase [Actinoalloteichus]APU15142.1 protein tyrosine/serine phosphatase [Actinoalloteichus fjordicus]APU21210.1 protein tyrosine/serine phosphatase [Actinoalloteichus sp. GBA129-24]